MKLFNYQSVFIFIDRSNNLSTKRSIDQAFYLSFDLLTYRSILNDLNNLNLILIKNQISLSLSLSPYIHKSRQVVLHGRRDYCLH